MLKKLSIQQYKGFYVKESLEFAVPDGAKDGSGLTLIVGPNNTGKSTIIESLLLTGEKKFTDAERHPGKQVKITIENVAGVKSSYTNEIDNSPINVSAPYHDIKFELIPSRRAWSPEFSGSQTFDAFVTQSIKPNIRRIDPTNLGPLLQTIRSSGELKDKFNALLKRLLPHFTDWAIDTNSVGSDYIKYETSNTTHQSYLLGEGFISLFRIAAHLIHNDAATFIIDEPELSLHPTAQKRLAEVLSELSRDKQIIVCTHSPYFVSWLDFINGGKIVRLNKHKDVRCIVNALDVNENYGNFIGNNIDEYQKPHLLDTTAKEVLFTERILFVEGQEDVGIIRKWAKENNKNLTFDIFGYGVGGFANMGFFLKMASDLNIEKVGALYDSGTASFAEDVAAYPNYCLQELNTVDIRDKKDADGNIVKVGTFTSGAELKPAEKDGFEAIMENFIQHFS